MHPNYNPDHNLAERVEQPRTQEPGPAVQVCQVAFSFDLAPNTFWEHPLGHALLRQPTLCGGRGSFHVQGVSQNLEIRKRVLTRIPFSRYPIDLNP